MAGVVGSDNAEVGFALALKQHGRPPVQSCRVIEGAIGCWEGREGNAAEAGDCRSSLLVNGEALVGVVRC